MFDQKDNDESLLEDIIGDIDFSEDVSDEDPIADIDELDEELAAEEAKVDEEVNSDDSDYPQEWYLLSTATGKEFKAKEELEENIKESELSKYFGEIYIPLVTSYQVRGTKTKKVEKKKFPGNVFIQMHMNADTYQFVRSQRRVSSFTGNKKGQRPIPLRPGEIEAIRASVERSEREITIVPGHKVQIIGGTLANNEGEVVSVKHEEMTAIVLVDMFAGRKQQVEIKIADLKVID